VFSASYWSFLLSPVPAILAARILKKRAILHYHSGEAERHLASWGTLVHPWLRLVDAIVVPSPYLRNVFVRHGYDVSVIPNVIDTSRFRFRERNPLRPRLLSTRNFEPHYRLEDTLAAFSLVKGRYPAASLALAGHGSEERRIRALAAALPTGDVNFLGRVEAESMPSLYEQSDIFVNFSIIDNQPVSILEAFAAGLPVVSTAIGDIGSIVRDGETGFLIMAEDLPRWRMPWRLSSMIPIVRPRSHGERDKKSSATRGHTSGTNGAHLPKRALMKSAQIGNPDRTGATVSMGFAKETSLIVPSAMVRSPGISLVGATGATERDDRLPFWISGKPDARGGTQGVAAVLRPQRRAVFRRDDSRLRGNSTTQRASFRPGIQPAYVACTGWFAWRIAAHRRSARPTRIHDAGAVARDELDPPGRFAGVAVYVRLAGGLLRAEGPWISSMVKVSP